VIAGVGLNPDDIMTCDVPTYAVDLSIALDHLTLTAVEKGLGTCWIGAFNQEKVKEILGIPDKYKVVSIMPLGYPADSPRPKDRKDFDQVVCFDKFEE
ncbi:MAG: nitroreductase family protein, partial [Halanaerobiales bacterium]